MNFIAFSHDIAARRFGTPLDCAFLLCVGGVAFARAGTWAAGAIITMCLLMTVFSVMQARSAPNSFLCCAKVRAIAYARETVSFLFVLLIVMGLVTDQMFKDSTVCFKNAAIFGSRFFDHELAGCAPLLDFEGGLLLPLFIMFPIAIRKSVIILGLRTAWGFVALIIFANQDLRRQYGSQVLFFVESVAALLLSGVRDRTIRTEFEEYIGVVGDLVAKTELSEKLRGCQMAVRTCLPCVFEAGTRAGDAVSSIADEMKLFDVFDAETTIGVIDIVCLRDVLTSREFASQRTPHADIPSAMGCLLDHVRAMAESMGCVVVSQLGDSMTLLPLTRIDEECDQPDAPADRARRLVSAVVAAVHHAPARGVTAQAAVPELCQLALLATCKMLKHVQMRSGISTGAVGCRFVRCGVSLAQVFGGPAATNAPVFARRARPQAIVVCHRTMALVDLGDKALSSPSSCNVEMGVDGMHEFAALDVYKWFTLHGHWAGPPRPNWAPPGPPESESPTELTAESRHSDSARAPSSQIPLGDGRRRRRRTPTQVESARVEELGPLQRALLQWRCSERCVCQQSRSLVAGISFRLNHFGFELQPDAESELRRKDSAASYTNIISSGVITFLISCLSLGLSFITGGHLLESLTTLFGAVIALLSLIAAIGAVNGQHYILCLVIYGVTISTILPSQLLAWGPFAPWYAEFHMGLPRVITPIMIVTAASITRLPHVLLGVSGWCFHLLAVVLSGRVTDPVATSIAEVSWAGLIVAPLVYRSVLSRSRFLRSLEVQTDAVDAERVLEKTEAEFVSALPKDFAAAIDRYAIGFTDAVAKSVQGSVLVLQVREGTTEPPQFLDAAVIAAILGPLVAPAGVPVVCRDSLWYVMPSFKDVPMTAGRAHAWLLDVAAALQQGLQPMGARVHAGVVSGWMVSFVAGEDVAYVGGPAFEARRLCLEAAWGIAAVADLRLTDLRDTTGRRVASIPMPVTVIDLAQRCAEQQQQQQAR